MKQGLFQFLPSEITFNILSRLHVRAIATSKCVCKQWLDLLSTDEFVNSHLCKSVPALAVIEGEVFVSMRVKVFEFEDGDEADDDDVVERRYNLLTEFDFPDSVGFVGAVDGLILLIGVRDLFICNPITRECVELCCPIKEFIYSCRRPRPRYGFGSSKITGQHKIVEIIIPNSETNFGCKCCVYTLETGSWRCIEIELTAASFRHCESSYGAFVNGNLYWIGLESIICFDLETECVSMFSAPPLEETGYILNICALKDYLCVCAVMSSEDEDYDVVISIWLMKEYGVEKCWTKEYVIGLGYDFASDVFICLYPIKVFKNGDILISIPMGEFDCVLFHYSNKTRALQKIDMLDRPDGYLYTWLFTPSFLSLESLGMEDVMSF